MFHLWSLWVRLAGPTAQTRHLSAAAVLTRRPATRPAVMHTCNAKGSRRPASKSKVRAHFYFIADVFCINMVIVGPVAQWIRHRPTEAGVAGSSPAGVMICRQMNLGKRSSQQTNKQPRNQIPKVVRTHCGLSPGRSTCKADVIPLHRVPSTGLRRTHTDTCLSPLFPHRKFSMAAGFLACRHTGRNACQV